MFYRYCVFDFELLIFPLFVLMTFGISVLTEIFKYIHSYYQKSKIFGNAQKFDKISDIFYVISVNLKKEVD